MTLALGDEPVAKQLIKLSWRLFQTVHAPSQVTDVRDAVIEPKWVCDVDIRFDGGVQERRVDVKPAELDVARCRDAEEDAEVGKSYDRREGLCVVDPLALTTALGDEPSLVPRDSPKGVCFPPFKPTCC
jgi:hypothetical protein